MCWDWKWLWSRPVIGGTIRAIFHRAEKQEIVFRQCEAFPRSLWSNWSTRQPWVSVRASPAVRDGRCMHIRQYLPVEPGYAPNHTVFLQRWRIPTWYLSLFSRVERDVAANPDGCHASLISQRQFSPADSWPIHALAAHGLCRQEQYINQFHLNWNSGF